MKNLFLFLALLLAVTPAIAQNVPTAAQPDALPATQAAPDTAAAIHRLFVAKRHVYRYMALGTIVAVGAAIAIVASVPNAESSGTGGGSGGFNAVTFSSSGDSNPAIFGMAVCSVPVLLVETLCCAGWSRREERRTLEAWQQHHLSAFYHRKLKPKYFK